MGKILLITLLSFFIAATGSSQSSSGTSFYGNNKADLTVCPASANFLNEAQVNDLITEMLDKYGIKNRYIIINCPQVENCQAILYKGKPYILYNPDFLGSVKKLNFSSSNLQVPNKDWEALIILAHELGHHVNNHLLNPLPDATQRDMELEADETAGFMIYMLGGTLVQAQLAYRNIPAEGSYTHPARQQRLDAIAKGFTSAATKFKNPTTNVVGKNSITDIDGNIYATVRIGGQTWMAENLKVTTYRNGDPIPEVKSKTEWSNLTTGAWCYYNNDPENGKTYGILYNWYAVNDPRGLAPVGYKIPTEADLNKLMTELGGEYEAGGKMKAVKLWNSPNERATNSSGFTGLPGGYRMGYAGFSNQGNTGSWWGMRPNDSDSIFNFRLRHDLKGCYTNISDSEEKQYGYSVRCVKN